MPKLTGNCLCGQVNFKADGPIAFQGNCHCSDCQQVTGAAYATNVFMKETDVDVSGELNSYSHKVDSGNTLVKAFCPNCGSQMFGYSENRHGVMHLRAGSINEKEHVQPQFNVYASRKLDCTILDETIPAFDKMPPG